MAALDFTDFYIITKDNPRYIEMELIEDDVIRVILQKYEMILFTNKGELLGEPDFGANLYDLLFSTKVSSDFVKSTIIEQISLYIPELFNINYDLDVVFVQDPQNFQDIMFIYLRISDYEVYAQFGNTSQL